MEWLNREGVVNPISAMASRIVVVYRMAAIEYLDAVLEPTQQDRQAQYEQQVADDRSGDGCLDQLEQSRLDGEQRDDQFGRITQRGIDQPTDPWTGMGGQVFGGLTDQTGQRDYPSADRPKTQPAPQPAGQPEWPKE